MPRRNAGPRLKWLDKRGCWYIVWTERGRSRQRSTGTAHREEAHVALAQFLRAAGRRSGIRDPAEVLVTDLLVDYAEAKSDTIAAARIGYAVDALTGFWAGRVVADVTDQSCAQYVAARCRAAGTVRRELGTLRAAINHARLTRPVEVKLPEAPPPRDRWLTRKEAASLVRAARTPQARLYLPLFILIGLYTGRRKEAILSLRWPQVDLDAGLIDFDGTGRRTKKRRGKAPIPARLLPHLRRAWKRGTEMGFVLHDHGERLGDVKKGYAGACRRAGLVGVTPHTLRHTAATWLMQAGVDLWEASGYLAMSVETLKNTYGHHHPDYLRAAADAIGRRPRNVRVTR